jgi:hypothetical protein
LKPQQHVVVSGKGENLRQGSGERKRATLRSNGPKGEERSDE